MCHFRLLNRLVANWQMSHIFFVDVDGRDCIRHEMYCSWLFVDEDCSGCKGLRTVGIYTLCELAVHMIMTICFSRSSILFCCPVIVLFRYFTIKSGQFVWLIDIHWNRAAAYLSPQSTLTSIKNKKDKNKREISLKKNQIKQLNKRLIDSFFFE